MPASVRRRATSATHGAPSGFQPLPQEGSAWRGAGPTAHMLDRGPGQPVLSGASLCARPGVQVKKTNAGREGEKEKRSNQEAAGGGPASRGCCASSCSLSNGCATGEIAGKWLKIQGVGGCPIPVGPSALKCRSETGFHPRAPAASAWRGAAPIAHECSIAAPVTGTPSGGSLCTRGPGLRASLGARSAARVARGPRSPLTQPSRSLRAHGGRGSDTDRSTGGERIKKKRSNQEAAGGGPASQGYCASSCLLSNGCASRGWSANFAILLEVTLGCDPSRFSREFHQ